MAKLHTEISFTNINFPSQYRANVGNGVTLYFAPLFSDGSGDDRVPDVAINFTAIEISKFSPEEWESIYIFMCSNAHKMIDFANNKDKERQRLEQIEYEKRVSEQTHSTKDVSTTGYVYLLLSDTGYYKIGKTKTVDSRVLRLETIFPGDLKLIHSFKSDYYSKAEKHLQNHYVPVHIKGEWFNLSDDDVREIVSIQDYDLDYLFRSL